jgi:hypothetical protein
MTVNHLKNGADFLKDLFIDCLFLLALIADNIIACDMKREYEEN